MSNVDLLYAVFGEAEEMVISLWRQDGTEVPEDIGYSPQRIPCDLSAFSVWRYDSYHAVAKNKAQIYFGTARLDWAPMENPLRIIRVLLDTGEESETILDPMMVVNKANPVMLEPGHLEMAAVLGVRPFG